MAGHVHPTDCILIKVARFRYYVAAQDYLFAVFALYVHSPLGRVLVGSGHCTRGIRPPNPCRVITVPFFVRVRA